MAQMTKKVREAKEYQELKDKVRLLEVRLWFLTESLTEVTKLINQLLQPRKEQTL